MEKIDIKDCTDQELIVRYQRGEDRKAISELLQRYYHLIYGACFKVLGTEEDAKDVCLDVCESLFEKLKTAKVDYFNGWLFSVCNNMAISFIRKRTTRLKHERGQYYSEISGENIVENRMLERLSAEGPEKTNLDQAKDQMGSLMSQLPQAQRFCLQLFYYKNMSYAQIAAATDSEIGQVKSHLQSGKRKLRLLFEKANQRSI